MSPNPFDWGGLEADYQQMIRAFKHINGLSPKSRQDYVLTHIPQVWLKE